jgi:hypothetical protein
MPKVAEMPGVTRHAKVRVAQAADRRDDQEGAGEDNAAEKYQG